MSTAMPQTYMYGDKRISHIVLWSRYAFVHMADGTERRINAGAINFTQDDIHDIAKQAIRLEAA